ncbi:MAG: response regulator transcription factor [Sphingobacteriales bacterium]|nr:MAG: response regulator transcription factor [Sphingobacteriales bacterium]
MIKLFIADDHQMIIDGLKSLLVDEENIQIAGEANDGFGVLKFLEKESCDIILLDINMPQADGIFTTQEVKKHFPQVKIIILSMHNSRDFVDSVLSAGAEGYILKNAGRDELLTAIETVNNGSYYYSSEILKSLAQPAAKPKLTETVQLSKRELEIIAMIAAEQTTQEIAAALFISPHTVDTHRKNLLAKLNVRNTIGLVKYALQNGLYSAE